MVLGRVSKVAVLSVIFATFTLVQMAAAADLSKLRPHVTVNLASYHLNATRDFNEFNPGIAFGVTAPSGIGASEFGLEVGQYRNSLSSQSYYVTSSLDTEVAAFSDSTRLRLGAFAGFSHYPGDANKFRDQGVPTIGNWVLAVGAQASVRVNDTYDVRLRVLPAGKVADALFTLQVATRF